MADSDPKDQQGRRTAQDPGVSIQEMFDLQERVLGKLGLLPGTPALDSDRAMVVQGDGGEAAGKEKTQ